MQRSGTPAEGRDVGATLQISGLHFVTQSISQSSSAMLMFETITLFSGDCSAVAEQHGYPAAEPEPRRGEALQWRLSQLQVLRGLSQEGEGGLGDDGEVPGGGGEV